MSVSSISGGGNYQPLAPVNQPVKDDRPLAPNSESDLTPVVPPANSPSSVDIKV